MYRLVFLTLFLSALFVFSSNAQDTPEKFSNDFLNCFVNYSNGCMKKFVSDTVAEKPTLASVDALYESEVKKNIKGKLTISSSTRAILKDGDAKHKQIADIIIQISVDPSTKYKMILWGCYELNGKWYLGEKIEMKRL